MVRRAEIQYIRYYTDGSAARKVATAAPLMMLKLPKVKKLKKKTLYIDPMAIAGIAMSVMMAVLMVIGAVRLSNARQEMVTMSGYVQTLREENIRLEQDFADGYDIEEIHRTATALGMIPKENAEHVSLRIPDFQEVEDPTAWDRITTFLAGLFA